MWLIGDTAAHHIGACVFGLVAVGLLSAHGTVMVHLDAIAMCPTVRYIEEWWWVVLFWQGECRLRKWRLGW